MIILASGSPRRRKLMEEISSSFMVVIPTVDEGQSFKKYKSVRHIVKDVSYRKCLEVAKNYPHNLIISADTVVVMDKEIIGKPKDQEEAFNILKKLSNRHHYVYTAYTLKKGDILVQNIVKSTVCFNSLSDDLIHRYVATSSPMDKAGAYGLQDNDHFPIIKKVVGSPTNVIGFPLEEIKRDLQKYFTTAEDLD